MQQWQEIPHERFEESLEYKIALELIVMCQRKFVEISSQIA